MRATPSSIYKESRTALQASMQTLSFEGGVDSGAAMTAVSAAGVHMVDTTGTKSPGAVAYDVSKIEIEAASKLASLAAASAAAAVRGADERSMRMSEALTAIERVSESRNTHRVTERGQHDQYG